MSLSTETINASSGSFQEVPSRAESGVYTRARAESGVYTRESGVYTPLSHALSTESDEDDGRQKKKRKKAAKCKDGEGEGEGEGEDAQLANK